MGPGSDQDSKGQNLQLRWSVGLWLSVPLFTGNNLNSFFGWKALSLGWLAGAWFHLLNHTHTSAAIALVLPAITCLLWLDRQCLESFLPWCGCLFLFSRRVVIPSWLLLSAVPPPPWPAGSWGFSHTFPLLLWSPFFLVGALGYSGIGTA